MKAMLIEKNGLNQYFASREPVENDAKRADPSFAYPLLLRIHHASGGVKFGPIKSTTSKFDKRRQIYSSKSAPVIINAPAAVKDAATYRT